MATLILTAVGTAAGGPIGGALGAMLGQTLDAQLFAPKARQGPRLGELAVQTSSYGSAIPKLFGTMRVAGTMVWATDLIERRTTSGGGKGRAKTVDYSYVANFAVALSARPILSAGRIWADGKLLRGAGGDFKVKTGFRLHRGSEAQAVDPLIAAAEGTARAPAFRGIAYAVFEELELAEFGNRIPSLSFEVIADGAPVSIAQIGTTLSGAIAAGAGTRELQGFAASGDSVRGALAELVELDGLSLRDEAGRLTLGAPAVGGPAWDAMRESGRRRLTRGGGDGAPAEVTLAYHEPARDFQAGMQRAATGPAGAGPGERRAIAAALDAAQAKAWAERRLDLARAERVTASVRCGWAGADIRPGQLLTLPGESGRWRVRRRTLGDMVVTLELARWPEPVAAAAPAEVGRPVTEPDRPLGPTTLRVYDLPLGELIEGGEAGLAVLAAGTEPGWRGAALSVSGDGGASWRDVGGTAAPAVLGEAVTALPAGGTALLDLANAVEIALLNDEMVLTGCSDAALAAGTNLALLGDELLQYGVAEPLGGARWRLSRLLRGRRGTEWANGAHLAGEGFALLEPGAVRVLPLPAGSDQAAVLASGVGDAVPVAAERAVTGEALRPPAPVHLRAEPDGSGGLNLRWVRRSRLGWRWTDGADTPLGEERERYALVITGPGVERTVEVETPAFHYDAAMRAADGPGPLTLTLVQLGTHGRSRPAVLTLP